MKLPKSRLTRSPTRTDMRRARASYTGREYIKLKAELPIVKLEVRIHTVAERERRVSIHPIPDI